jgi:lysophospholipase L1-like esterase
MVAVPRVVYIWVSFTVFLLLTMYAVHIDMPERIIKHAKSLPNGRVYSNQLHKFSLYPVKSNLIVMFGNSITAGIDWNELMERPDIINRGINGDDTRRMLARIENITATRPKLVCLMAGINDIINNQRSPEEVMIHYNLLLDKARANNTRVLVFSTLYMYRQRTVNSKIATLNTLIKACCVRKKIAYMDLNAVLSDANGLKIEYSSDGLHLTGEAYLAWKVELSKWLKQNNI